MADNTEPQQPKLTSEQLREMLRQKMEQTPPGVNPGIDALRARQTQQSVEGAGLNPDDHEELSAWTLMRPDVLKQTGTAIARGGMEGWNSLVRTVAQVGHWDRQLSGRKADKKTTADLPPLPSNSRLAMRTQGVLSQFEEERQRFDAEGEKPFTKRQYGDATFSSEDKDQIAGKSIGGLYGIIEDLTEFGTEYALTGGVLRAATKAPLVGEALATGLGRLEKMKMAQGAVQSGLKAFMYDDPYADRVSNMIANAPADLSNPLVSWINAPLVQDAAGALGADPRDSYARAQLKNVVEDYLLGMPFAVAGVMLGAARKRIAKAVEAGALSDEAAQNLWKAADAHYADDIAKAQEDEAASMTHIVDTEDGRKQVVLTPKPVEAEAGQMSVQPDAPMSPLEPPPATAENTVAPNTVAPNTVAEGAAKPPGRGEIRGPILNTEVEARAAKGAIDRYHKLYDEAQQPIDETTMREITDRFAEKYKAGEKIDPRSVADILEEYGLNKRYLAAPEDNIAMIKSLADAMPWASREVRAKPTGWGEVIAMGKEMFQGGSAKSIKRAMMNLGIATEQAPAVLTVARANMILQHREIVKLTRQLAAHPGNQAIADMTTQAMNNLHALYSMVTGVNANIGRTLQVNQMPSDLLAQEFGADFKSGLSEAQRALTGEAVDVAKTKAKGGVEKARADGKLVRTETGGLDVGPKKLTQQEAIDMANVLAMSGEDNIEGAFKLLAAPTIKDAEKAAPEVKNQLLHKILAARTEAILSGFKTQAISLVSGIQRLIGSPAGLAWYGLTRMDAEALHQSFDLVAGTFLNTFEALRFAARSFKTGSSILDSRTLREDTFGMLDLSSVLEGPVLGPWNAVKILVRMPGRLLGTGDEFISQLAYRSKARMEILADMRDAIAKGDLDASKVDLDAVLARRMDAMTADGRGVWQKGIDYARDATYKRDLRGVAEAFQNLVNKHPALKLFFPFVRASANVFDHIHQATPVLNLFNRNMQEALARGGVDAKQAIARAEFGSAMYGLAGLFAATGMITGEGPRNPKVRQTWLQAGNKPYTITIGGKQYSYRRGDPYFSALGLMADFWSASGELDESSRTSLAGALIATFAANATSKSYMSNVDTLMQAFSSGDGSKIDRLLQASVASFVPSISRDLSTDPYEREVRGYWDAIVSRTPWSDKLEPRMNFFGEPMLRPPGFWNDAGNPFTAYPSVDSDPVASELAKLGRHIPEIPTSEMEGFIDLTDKEHFGADNGGKSPYLAWHEFMAKPGGSTPSLRETLTNLVQSGGWSKIPDGDEAYSPGGMKFQLASKIIMAYRRMGKAQMLKAYPSLMEALQSEMTIKMHAKIGGDAAAAKARELREAGKLIHRDR